MVRANGGEAASDKRAKVNCPRSEAERTGNRSGQGKDGAAEQNEASVTTGAERSSRTDTKQIRRAEQSGVVRAKREYVSALRFREGRSV